MIITVDGLRHGQLVRSIAGRDKGCYYVIYNMIEDRYVEVVDGDKHPIRKPKRKNIKHVYVTMLVAREIEDAILQGELSDTRIKAAIRNLIDELEEGDRFNG